MKLLKLILIDYSIDNLDWRKYPYSQFISKKTFIKYINNNDSVYQFTNISENFIRKFQNEIVWLYISAYQKLSENFIKEFQNKVNWWCISQHQNLSKEFMIEFINKINTYHLKDNKYISQDDIKYILQMKKNII